MNDVCLLMYLSSYNCMYLSMSLSIYLSIFLSIYLCVNVRVYGCKYGCLFVYKHMYVDGSERHCVCVYMYVCDNK